MIADVGEAPDNAHRADPTLEEIQAVLDRAGAGRNHGICRRSGWHRFESMSVRWPTIARAACSSPAMLPHVHSPAGGQGMNTGIQDACNLAWKLALVCRGLAAPEPLLDSYSIERSAVGRQVLSDAGRLTTIAILKSGVLQEVRNQFASLVFGLSPVRQGHGEQARRAFDRLSDQPAHASRVATDTTGPAPGERAPITNTAHPVGAGPTPRLRVIRTSLDPEASESPCPARDLLEPEVRARSTRTASGSCGPTATLPRSRAWELGPKSTTISCSILAGESGKRAERH